ncbi:MAG: hypothetical protein B7Z08_12995 [Sphingomonadales bacterium 32-68-7]|nr:MAG: hypothetical protein B7Z33_05585 [Sphingomonadales bacterium 12-68-11]OYX07087.1 MAG: hypothetical protein B7Z08_12995 [Sphingomonadales bacterium 32-68-7]
MKLQKETSSSDGHGKWYGDACGTAFAMELIGERWSMLIVRELMLGGRRFSDLRARLAGLSAKVLTERLVGLEQAGVLQKRVLPPPAASRIYELTPWGYHAEFAIRELGRWAARSPAHDPTLPMTPVGIMLSMRTLIDPVAARPLTGMIGFEADGESFVGHLGGGELNIVRGDTAGVDLLLRMRAPEELGILLYAKVPVEVWEQGEGRAIEGDRELARQFIDLFALPEKIA